MYRLRDNLRMGKKVLPIGEIHELASLSSAVIEKLIEKGAIAPIATPPLSALPGPWGYRARRLRKKARIVTVEDLLSADSGKVADVTGLRPGTVDTWKEEAKEYLKTS